MIEPQKNKQACPVVKSFIFGWYDQGIEGTDTSKSGPLSVRQQNAIKMALRGRADDGPTLNTGDLDPWVLIRNHIIFYFSGGSWHPAPSRPAHNNYTCCMLTTEHTPIFCGWSLTCANTSFIKTRPQGYTTFYTHLNKAQNFNCS